MALWLLLLVVLFPRASAWARDTEEPGRAQTVTLSNGARLVVLTEPDSPHVVFDVFFRVGLPEAGRWGSGGLSALATRAWLSDTEYRSAALLQADLAQSGAAVGANAGDDWAEIWSVSGADEAAMRKSSQTLLTNLVALPTFSQNAVEGARRVQLGSVALRRDDLLGATLDALRARAYGLSPYAQPLLGEPDSLTRLPWRDVGQFYFRYFRPDRMVIVAAGNITLDDARKRVEDCLGAAGDWAMSKSARTPTADPVPPIPPNFGTLTLPRADTASVWAQGYLAPGTAASGGPMDWAALSVFDAVVGGGKASRLFGLRDNAPEGTPAVGYELRTVLLPTRTQSLWAIYVVGDNPAASTRDAVTSLLRPLADGTIPITDAELVRAKIYLRTRHRAERQRLKERAAGLGWAETMGLGARWETDYDALINAVTLDDVSRMARRVLASSPATVQTGISPPAPTVTHL